MNGNEDFLSTISNMTDDEINELIEKEGKDPKPIPMIRIAEE
jgi:hypothetical protein